MEVEREQPTIKIVISALREAKQKWKQLQQMHLSLWETYLERLAKSLVLKISPQLDDPTHKSRLNCGSRKRSRELSRRKKGE
jgi:hypothetical protein